MTETLPTQAAQGPPADLAGEATIVEGIEVRWNAPLGLLTSLKVGGSVTALVQVRDVEELGKALRFARQAGLPFAVLGAGSNLLVPDGLTRAMVVRLTGEFRDLRVDGEVAVAGAAAKCAQVARRLCQDGLGGLEFAAGIPGSIGGAVAMNAGYGGRSMADAILSVKVLGPSGEVTDLAASDLELSYRHSRIRRTGEIVLQATLRLSRVEPEILLEEIRKGDRHRSRTQPLSAPSCGSVFKNPPGDHAGRLIDAAGLKGARHGAAEVSRVHANFIVTAPGSPAADVEALIAMVRERVRDRFGLMLETEVVDLRDCLRDLS